MLIANLIIKENSKIIKNKNTDCESMIWEKLIDKPKKIIDIWNLIDECEINIQAKTFDQLMTLRQTMKRKCTHI